MGEDILNHGDEKFLRFTAFGQKFTLVFGIIFIIMSIALPYYVDNVFTKKHVMRDLGRREQMVNDWKTDTERERKLTMLILADLQYEKKILLAVKRFVSRISSIFFFVVGFNLCWSYFEHRKMLKIINKLKK